MKSLLRLVVPALVACVSAASAAGARTELDGVWLFYGAQVPEDPGLNAAGRAKLEQYDPLRDDTDLSCKPVTFTNIMHTPSPPIEIRLHAEDVEINYEFMDVHRRVPTRPGMAVKDAPYAVTKYLHLGRSVARYEGEMLVIETVDIGAGVHDTLGMPGLPQSNQMRTVERFVANGNRMTIAVTHYDPVFYVKPYVATFSYLRLPKGKILPWNCTPEEANYERFIPKQK